MHFVGNRSSKRLHIQELADGRCKMNLMREEYRIDFDNLDQALSYPEGKPPIFHRCAFCFSKYNESIGE